MALSSAPQADFVPDRRHLGGIEDVNLLPGDYARIAELNDCYADLPGDVADLTLLALSERLEVKESLSLDGILMLTCASGGSRWSGCGWAENSLQAAFIERIG